MWRWRTYGVLAELPQAQEAALRPQLAAAVEQDVVLERLGIEPLRAELVQPVRELVAVFQGEFDFDFSGHLSGYRVTGLLGC